MTTTAISNTTPVRLKLGEIFEYTVFDPDDKVNVARQCFFIKVNRDYFLIGLDNDNSDGQEDHYSFFGDIVGMKRNGKVRDGKDPFSYREVLEFLKLRSVRVTGKMVFKSKKKVEKKNEKKGDKGYGGYSAKIVYEELLPTDNLAVF